MSNIRSGKIIIATLVLLSCLCVSLAGAADLGKAIEAYEQNDYKSSFKDFHELATKNQDSSAQFYLGLMTELGQGIPQDYIEALKWYRLSAKQGNKKAQASLGFLYSRGIGVPLDNVEAFKWYKLAAEQGEALSQNRLALMYARGEGVKRNKIEAHKWANLAAAQGQKDSDKLREAIAKSMTPKQIAEAKRQARKWKPKVKL